MLHLCCIERILVESDEKLLSQLLCCVVSVLFKSLQVCRQDADLVGQRAVCRAGRFGTLLDGFGVKWPPQAAELVCPGLGSLF